jgi:ParB-like chromosome segregation protein Spo0J
MIAQRRTLDDREAEHGTVGLARSREATKVHPVADAFPAMSAAELQELAEDIKAKGLAHPIVRDRDGIILDGRNRLAGCKLAGIEPRFTVFAGDDPVAFIISSNLKRRHLNESQRAMVAAKLANLAHGGDRRSDQAENLPLETVKQATAAAMLNVSDRSVRHAGVVHKHGTPELIRAVEQGTISVSAAAKQAKPPLPPPKPHASKEAINVAPIKSAFDLVQGAAARGDTQRLRQHLRKLLHAVEEALK